MTDHEPNGFNNTALNANGGRGATSLFGEAAHSLYLPNFDCANKNIYSRQEELQIFIDLERARASFTEACAHLPAMIDALCDLYEREMSCNTGHAAGRIVTLQISYHWRRGNGLQDQPGVVKNVAAKSKKEVTADLNELVKRWRTGNRRSNKEVMDLIRNFLFKRTAMQYLTDSLSQRAKTTEWGSRAFLSMRDVIDIENEIVDRNVRLTTAVTQKKVHSISDSNVTVDILTSWGHVGLMRAVETFTYQSGYRLSTYATIAIKNAIPRNVTQEDALRKRYRQVEDLQTYFPGEQEEDLVLKNELEGSLQESFAHSKLTFREKRVLTLRYGLDGKGKRTLEEMRGMLGENPGSYRSKAYITRERVRQIELEALEKLRNSEALQPFFDRT